jgi:gliding motility-associated lipoprotein GldD
MKKSLPFIILILLFFTACKEESFPKPKGYLKLAYPNAKYKKTNFDCPFSFEVAKQTKVWVNKKCWVKIKYPKLNATIDITYLPVKNNLKELFLEADKLTTKHSIKADKISFIPYVNKKQQVYGKMSNVTGNAASPIQFHVTDSTKHFLTGALYFNVQPNYDSILPAINYIEKDIVHLIETLHWKKESK